MDQMFVAKLERLRSITTEAATLGRKLDVARAGVEEARAVAEEARVTAVLDGTPAAATAAEKASRELESALASRDGLEEHAEVLQKARERLKADLAAGARAARAASLAEATAAAGADLKARSAEIREVLVAAGVAHMLASRGPLDQERLGDGLIRGADLAWPEVLKSIHARYDEIQAKAAEPSNRLDAVLR